MNLKNNNKGFTLVELLIVIVIIAILAAISIVAYNGITDRAHNSAAKDAASQVKTKAELYKQIKGEYPATADAATGFTDSEAVEASLGELQDKQAASASAIDAKDNLFYYERCSADAGKAQISYYDTKGSGTPKVSVLKLNGGCA